jgi:hypothetical protein
MSFNHVDLYREGFHTYDIICDFIYDFIIIIFLITSQVVIIAWFYKNEQSMSEMSKQIELLKSSSNMRMSEMSKQIETLKSTINTNKIISDKNEQSLSEMSKQIESVKTFSCFILFNDTENTGNYITLLDEKNIMNLLQFYSSLKYHDIPRIFNVFIKIWLRHATEDQLIMIIPKFIKYNYAYEFDGVYEGRTNFYFNDPNFLRYFKDATRGYNNSEELHNRITNAFVYIDNSLK